MDFKFFIASFNKSLTVVFIFSLFFFVFLFVFILIFFSCFVFCLFICFCFCCYFFPFVLISHRKLHVVYNRMHNSMYQTLRSWNLTASWPLPMSKNCEHQRTSSDRWMKFVLCRVGTDNGKKNELQKALMMLNWKMNVLNWMNAFHHLQYRHGRVERLKHQQTHN